MRAHLVMTFPQDWLHESAEWDVEKSLTLLADLAGVPPKELSLSNEAALSLADDAVALVRAVVGVGAPRARA